MYVLSFAIVLYLSVLANGIEIRTRTYETLFSASDPSITLRNFSNNDTLKFQRLMIHGNNLYVGATNNILQLSISSLTLQSKYITGPGRDDPSCPSPPYCYCDDRGCKPKNTENNYNKILVPYRDRLIACGTLHRTCNLLTLSNVSMEYLPNNCTESDCSRQMCDRLTCQSEASSALSVRSQTLPLVAALYVNPLNSNSDLLYVGTSNLDYPSKKTAPTQVYYGPSRAKPYFTFSATTANYINAIGNTAYHLAWTTSQHSFLVRKDYTHGAESQAWISRICHSSIYQSSRGTTTASSNDISKRSYVDGKLACNFNGKIFTEIISAKYLFEKLYIFFHNEQDIVLCSIPLSSVNAYLNESRRMCFTTSFNNAVILGSSLDRASCSNAPGFAESWVACGWDSANRAFLGAVRILNSLNMTFEMDWPRNLGEIPTSFTVGSENNLFAAFVGTSSGNIIKAQFGNNTFKVSEKVNLNQQEPVHNMVLDESGQNIIGLSKTKIHKASVANCEEQYPTCAACMQSHDPYCGWCVLRSRCTRKTTCQDSNDNNKWIPPNMPTDRCPNLSATPSLVSIGLRTMLQLKFAGAVLQPNLSYKCHYSANNADNVFSSSIVENLGTSKPQCSLSTEPASVISSDSDHVNVTVSISYNGAHIVKGSLTVYDCSSINTIHSSTRCTSCLVSPWNCSFCSNSQTCTSSPCDSIHHRITADSSCPLNNGITNASVSLPVGKPRTFTINTSNLKNRNMEKALICEYRFCNRTSNSNAMVASTTGVVSCSASAQQLTCGDQSSTLRVILRSGDYIIDIPMPSSITVEFFNCSALGSDCGRCVVSSNMFQQCGWCMDASSCLPTCKSSIAIRNIRGCDPAVITSISPPNGPVEGGTTITIKGSNLGSNISDISSVKIGDAKCNVEENAYLPAVRIVCQTGSVLMPMSSSVKVMLTYTNGTSTYEEAFEYAQVVAERYEPRYVFDNSSVTIIGQNLSVGNAAYIYVDGKEMEKALCSNRSPTSLTCLVPHNVPMGNHTLSIKLDRYQKNFSIPLEYVKAPQQSKAIGDILAFRSGGGRVSVGLSNIRAVQTATLQVNDGVKNNCTIDRRSKSVNCTLPPEPGKQLLRRRRRRQVTSLASLEINGFYPIRLGPVTYKDDPILSNLIRLKCVTGGPSTQSASANGNTSIESLGDSIQLKGLNFRSTGAAPSDYTVMFKPVNTDVSIPCIVTHMEETDLFCSASAAELSLYENQIINIVVQVGTYTIPPVDAPYCMSSQFSFIPIIIPVVVVVLLLLLIILVILIYQQRRTKRLAMEQLKMLSKLDDLENKTRVAGRNAYYELQVGYMENLSGNLSDRINYHPSSMYFMQTLFNCPSGHPVVDKMALKNESAQRMEALEEWIKMLKKEKFILSFIRTLEEQKKFTVQGKGNVASLLVVCMFSDLPYFTKIMLKLLSELIQRHVLKNPKLLLRRSESVVEKMVSHWLSITLYEEGITKKSGKPIFLLTKAIHYLVGSAPCDVIANKAFNSLNEMTLLGSEIDHEMVTLHASIEEIETGEATSPVEVKVVNVDSITQAKTKIVEAVYKDRPYSECPLPDDLEFHLLSGEKSKEGIILSDIDSMSSNEGNYTKINTLKHYNVPNDAFAMLRPPSALSTPNCEHGGFEMFLHRNYSFNSNTIDDIPSSPTSKAPLLSPSHARHIYHLINPREDDIANGFNDFEDGKGGKRANAVLEELINRPFQEFFLTRMVRSKTALQEYVDGVFKSILLPNPVPKAICYFFQFLDTEAARFKINDPEVIHIWKTNSLLLRYWVNILKNPEFLFDTNKTSIVDSCLNVITQAFMDACSPTSRKLAHDSPSNKLLYAKDAENYKKMVKEFFVQVSNTPWLQDDDINVTLKAQSEKYAPDFNQHVAAKQLYKYLTTYHEEILENLRNDGEEKLAQDVEMLTAKMEDRTDVETTVV